MADEEVVERKDATERRVYNLPMTLLLKLRAFQASQNIPSETEAARRLIESALQARETVFSILSSVEVMLSDDLDLRSIGAELMKHSLISAVMLMDGSLIFTMTNGNSGKVAPDRRGSYDLHYTDDEWRNDNWSRFDQWKRDNLIQSKRSSSLGPGGGGRVGGWEPTGDLDDEIPF